MKYKKIISLAIIIILIIILNGQFGWSKALSDQNMLQQLQAIMRTHYWYGVMIYSVVTIVGCVVLALPGISFAILAGLLFGPWEGTLYCLLATTLGASGAFLVGRFFLKDTVKPMVQKNSYMNKLLFSQNKHRDITLLMITRLIPIFPYNLQNFAYGITDMGFFTFTGYTFVFMLPGVAFMTIGFAGIVAKGNQWVYFVIAAVLFIGVIVVSKKLKRKYL